MGQPNVRLQRILVATDFSSGAREALDCALNIGRAFHTKIFLVHVIPTAAFRYVSPDSSEEAARQARAFAIQEMKKLVQEAGCEGEVREEVLFSGVVWPVLQEFAKVNEIDLIVLGTHDRSPGKSRLLGPVTEEIFRVADRPILTVAPPNRESGKQTGKIQRILYATNFKPHAERAAVCAYAMERELQARLTVLHVVEDPATAPHAGHKMVEEFLVQRMKKSIPAVCAGKCEPTFHVRFGDPAQEILRLASEEQSDLIVLGMRSGKSGNGLLPSAVAYELACQSPCPVLTIRH